MGPMEAVDSTLGQEQLERLIEVGRALVAERNPETVIDLALSAALELTGARYAALGILDSTRSELARFMTAGMDQETVAGIGDRPKGKGVRSAS